MPRKSILVVVVVVASEVSQATTHALTSVLFIASFFVERVAASVLKNELLENEPTEPAEKHWSENVEKMVSSFTRRNTHHRSRFVAFSVLTMLRCNPFLLGHGRRSSHVQQQVPPQHDWPHDRTEGCVVVIWKDGSSPRVMFLLVVVTLSLVVSLLSFMPP